MLAAVLRDAAVCLLQLNFMVRTLIRVMYGTALEPGSHAEAAAAYQRAVDLAPGRLVHRVELGRVLLHMRQPREAHAHLRVSPKPHLLLLLLFCCCCAPPTRVLLESSFKQWKPC